MKIDTPESILKYGLGGIHSSLNGYTTMTVEKGFARHYWLEHARLEAKPLSRRRERLQLEWEGNLLCLAHFLVDYLTQTCFGEARHCHVHASGIKDCSCYERVWKRTSATSRSGSAREMTSFFPSYEVAHEELLHIYWDHAWALGMGGWRWGNSAWIAHQLYQAFVRKDLNAMMHWIDVVANVTHNGGSCLLSKYSHYAFDSYLFNRILWAKYVGKPCCYEFLHALLNGSGDESACKHASSSQRKGGMIKEQVVLRPGYKPMQMCRRCKQPKRLDELERTGHDCLVYCPFCRDCTCHKLGFDCSKCLKQHVTHYCEGTCPYGCGQPKVGEMHSVCHHCLKSMWWPVSSAGLGRGRMVTVDGQEVWQPKCRGCFMFAFYVEPDAKSEPIILMVDSVNLPEPSEESDDDPPEEEDDDSEESDD